MSEPLTPSHCSERSQLALGHVGGAKGAGENPLKAAISFVHYLFNDQLLEQASAKELYGIGSAKTEDEAKALYQRLTLKPKTPEVQAVPASPSVPSQPLAKAASAPVRAVA